MTSLVITVLISALAIVGAGTLLARASDVIAARTKWGAVWVGSVFLAAATSLPEIVTDISAVRLDASDLAAGDLFGSSMANVHPARCSARSRRRMRSRRWLRSG